MFLKNNVERLGLLRPFRRSSKYEMTKIWRPKNEATLCMPE